MELTPLASGSGSGAAGEEHVQGDPEASTQAPTAAEVAQEGVQAQEETASVSEFGKQLQLDGIREDLQRILESLDMMEPPRRADETFAELHSRLQRKRFERLREMLGEEFDRFITDDDQEKLVNAIVNRTGNLKVSHSFAMTAIGVDVQARLLAAPACRATQRPYHLSISRPRTKHRPR